MEDRRNLEGWNDGAEWAFEVCLGTVQRFEDGAVWIREAMAKRLEMEFAAQKKERGM